MTAKLRAVPADTTLEAAQVQLAIYRRMTPEQRLERTFGLSESLHHLVAAGVRHRRPDLSEEDVQREVARLFLGGKTFREITCRLEKRQ